MKKNITIFLFFLIFVGFYIYYNNFNLTSAKLWIDPDLPESDVPLILCSEYEEVGCPWGNNYDSDIGIRTMRVYCESCPDFHCTTVEDPWLLHERCNDCQKCAEENDEYVCKQYFSPLSPTDGQEVPDPATLDWCNVQDATSYKTRVYERWWEDNAWHTEYVDELSSIDSAVCTRSLDLDDSSYIWKIAPCYVDGSCGSFGETWGFSVEGNQIKLDSPNLLEPKKNDDDISLPVTLQWDKVDDAKSYYIEVYDGDILVAFESPIATSITLGVNSLTNSTKYEWTVMACLGENGNACGKDCCFNESGDECSGSSSSRKFETNNEAVFNDVELISPSNETVPVKPSDIFEWKSMGATGFVFQIKESGQEVVRRNTQNTTTTLSIFRWADINAPLTFNTNYTWHVTPCWWDSENDEPFHCKTDQTESKSFITAGGQIESILSPDPNISSSIPALFSWQEVPNASSYLFQLIESSKLSVLGLWPPSWPPNPAFDSITTIKTRNNNLSLDYPIIKPEIDYSWRVKACAEIDGSVCEDDWHDQDFSTEEFLAPSSKQMDDEIVFTYEKNLIWELVSSAKSYKHSIQYDVRADKEINDDCVPSTPIQTDIISDFNYFLMPNFPELQQKCLGTYSLRVAACLNKDCEDQNAENSKETIWTFDYVQSESSQQGGIIPCGRDYDIESTPWNEREVCQLKHVPILIYSILDFILWKASLVALLFLIVFSGIISYASAGLPIKVVSLKEIWRTAGKGYLIMFFSWTIINLVLKVAGITDVWLILPF